MSTENETTALARVQPQAAIEPANMSELSHLAKQAAESGLFGFKTQQQALMVMMTGRDLGLSYAQAARAFHVINGKATLTADGMIAVCLQHRDICEYFRVVSSDENQATWETKRRGAEPVRQSFTMADAKAAGLLSNAMWAKYPKRMLSARAKSFLARDVYPELLMGLYDPDEAAEIQPQKTQVAVVGQAQQQPPAAPQVQDVSFEESPVEQALTGYARATSRADVDAIAESLRGRVKPGSADHARLLSAWKEACARVREADEERAAIQTEAAQ